MSNKIAITELLSTPLRVRDMNMGDIFDLQNTGVGAVYLCTMTKGAYIHHVNLETGRIVALDSGDLVGRIRSITMEKSDE